MIELDSIEAQADALRALISYFAAVGEPDLASRMWGAWDAALDETGQKPDPIDVREASTVLTRTRSSFGAVRVELAIQQGRASDRRTLFADALVGLAAPTTPIHENPSHLRHGTLTKREVEILGLVGAGMSDREIAVDLFISPKTASVHVANAKAKLGVGSRLELALRARELGLVDPAHVD